MTLEKIVDIYGSSIGEHLVSRRVEMHNEGLLRGIKTYKIELWEVTQHRIIFDVEKTCHINTDNRDIVVAEVEEQFIKRLFDLSCL